MLLALFCMFLILKESDGLMFGFSGQDAGVLTLICLSSVLRTLGEFSSLPQTWHFLLTNLVRKLIGLFPVRSFLLPVHLS